MASPAVEDRLVSAVERLVAAQSPSAVTMRAIAREAGVSQGLAYHYFESKEALFGAALDEMARQISQELDAAPVDSDSVTQLWSRMEQHPAFPRLLTWFLLTGLDPVAAMSGHPLLEQVGSQAAAEGRPDPVSFAGAVASLALTGAFFVPMINRATGRSSDDPRIAALLADMVRDSAVPGDFEARQGAGGRNVQ